MTRWLYSPRQLNDFFAIYRSEFLSETSGKMEIIKGIKWDPSDAVDKEIYEMQVEYIKTVIC